jgi:hypothetical protein
MTMNLQKFRENLRMKLSNNPELLKELNLNKPSELASLSDQQLEKLMTPRILGMLSLSKKDLEE